MAGERVRDALRAVIQDRREYYGKQIDTERLSLIELAMISERLQELTDIESNIDSNIRIMDKRKREYRQRQRANLSHYTEVIL